MSLFKRKIIPGAAVLPEPRLEAAAIEYAISRKNAALAFGRDHSAADVFFNAVNDKVDAAVKAPEEARMIRERAEYIRGQMEQNLLELRMLYARFILDKVKEVYDTGAYGYASFKVVFRAVPLSRLFGCLLYSGDEQYTEDGCIIYTIGFGATTLQLELIQQSLSKSLEFKEVCAKQPLRFKEESPFSRSEPLVDEGMVLFDSVQKAKSGATNAFWAFDKLAEQNELRI